VIELPGWARTAIKRLGEGPAEALKAEPAPNGFSDERGARSVTEALSEPESE
jgi:hypothetical protein